MYRTFFLECRQNMKFAVIFDIMRFWAKTNLCCFHFLYDFLIQLVTPVFFNGIEKFSRFFLYLKNYFRFRKGTTRVLISSDVLSRGIDVEDIDVVINYDKPLNERLLVHRVGRTARCGKKGRAVFLITAKEVGIFAFIYLFFILFQCSYLLF